MSYKLFILLNAILFIRPADLIPALEPLRLYQLVILGCLLSTYTEILMRINGEALARRPAVMCVIGLFVAVILSHLQFGSLYGVQNSGSEFGKLVLYFLLLLCNLDTPEKFQKFLTWLVVFTLIASGLALLQFYEVVDIPALAAYEQREMDEETGEMITFSRLCGAGMFNDPNDVCLMLVMAMMICIYRITDQEGGFKRILYLAPIGVFLVAFLETKSRGGFLALMVALNVLLLDRRGLRKAMPMWMLGAPVVLVVFGGRMTRIEVEGGTGQHRIQLWREALGLVRERPLFGVGQGLLPDYTRLVAHNSYVHSFAELGLFGGTCFISLVFLSIAQLIRLRRHQHLIDDPGMRRLRAYVLGIVCGFCAGIFSLSRLYVVPTYLVFGLAAAFLNHVRTENEENSPIWHMNSRMGAGLIGLSIAVLLALEVGSRLMVNWE